MCPSAGFLGIGEAKGGGVDRMYHFVAPEIPESNAPFNSKVQLTLL